MEKQAKQLWLAVQVVRKRAWGRPRLSPSNWGSSPSVPTLLRDLTLVPREIKSTAVLHLYVYPSGAQAS